MPSCDFIFTFEDTKIRAKFPFFSQFTCAIPKHSHSINSYEIHYVPSGRGTVNISGHDYRISPGTLYITGPDIDHEQIPDPDNPMSEYCLYLQIIKTKKAADKNRPLLNIFESTPFWLGQDKHNIKMLLDLIIKETDEKNIGYEYQVSLLYQQLIIIMIRNYQDCNCISVTKDSTHLYEPYLYIEQRFLYDYNNITLDKLASDIGLSNRQTERLLKHNYNMNFRQKKHQAKMSAAKTMLSDNNLSINEISERLNYSSAGHFSTSFKKYYGISPHKFRQNQ